MGPLWQWLGLVIFTLTGLQVCGVIDVFAVVFVRSEPSQYHKMNKIFSVKKERALQINQINQDTQ